ncbi:Cytoskeletal adhesion [Carpediemonas membranifera]|uniref:Cytoskeletal adhesion n=1 Tax=Carpediemonas membranifera TaxID=201153 RepID=A0A8J6B2C1_9EUKA|nr:Cytoskeletal adhesion [Carpediemonas membranifera]|eukprot:KAG9394233.1 Cytoskeletal adhesion [Carpediemonas membranifera]
MGSEMPIVPQLFSQHVHDSKVPGGLGRRDNSPNTLRTKLQTWQTALRKAIEYDKWGQPIEAEEGYASLTNSITAFLKTTPQPPAVDTLIRKLSLTVDLRCKAVADMDATFIDSRALEQVAALVPLLDEPDRVQTWPVDLRQWEGDQTPRMKVNPSNPDLGAIGGSLLARPAADPGSVYVAVRIKLAVVPDAHKMKDAMVTSTLVMGGRTVEVQHTPFARNATEDGKGLVFHDIIFLQKPFADMAGGRVFLELRHYKPDKRKISLRCYTYLDLGALQEGQFFLAWLKKPADYAMGKKKVAWKGEYGLQGEVKLWAG